MTDESADQFHRHQAIRLPSEDPAIDDRLAASEDPACDEGRADRWLAG